MYDVILRYHRVLILLSEGYPRVGGRLHTRYAPVRRSLGSKPPIPLDLHVLGPPLAFILSQDQTLHCKKLTGTSTFVWLPKYLCILSLLVRKTTSRPSSRLPIFSKNFILFCHGLGIQAPVPPSLFFPSLSFRECKGKRLFYSSKFIFDFFSRLRFSQSKTIRLPLPFQRTSPFYLGVQR